jgi:hypothetical protein
MQDCECILLNEDGTPAQVGVLSLPKSLRGSVKVGTYTGTFALAPDLRTRRIEAVLTGLTALPPNFFKRSPAPVPSAPAGAQ